MIMEFEYYLLVLCLVAVFEPSVVRPSPEPKVTYAACCTFM